jgi:serine/threonine-protein kinase
MPAQAVDHYGPYRVIRPLGGGGMGTVLLAEDPRLGRLVALKMISGQDATPPASRGQLLHEARAAARLAHPSIAAVHDVLDVGGETVIVFEYVEGETLAARLKRGRLPVSDALRLGEQLADGLAAAHAQGIIHRDLKPSNVMLTPDGRAKIPDFGIAHRSLDNDETSPALSLGVGMYAGTPAYAAPEQWLGESIGVHTDIFAFGLLLFEMLGGRRPFETKSRLALMHQVIEAPRPHVRELNANVPTSVDALITSMLSREPSQRPGSAREIAGILRSIERDLPQQRPRWGWPGRRAMRWVLLAAVLLIGVTLLVSPLRAPPPPRVASAMPVVAVLPLTNATGTAANDYLAAGVGDSLTTSLASLSGITVVSRAAVIGVAARDSDPATIARELGATYLVEGSVQRASDRVRLSVNLIRPDRSLAWADSVEGVIDTVFELQSRLAAALGRALSVQVSAADRVKLAQQPTSNAEALAAYWRGRSLLERRDVKGNTDAALGAFDDAVRQDPNFAMAHAGRGEALWVHYTDSKDPATAQEAIAAGTTALRLDPNSAQVRYTLAVTLAGTGRLDEAVDELQRALALQPNHDDARRELGSVLARQGKLDAALPEFQKAISLRPAYWGTYSAMGFYLYQGARYEEAVKAFQQVTVLQPDNYIGFQQLGTVYQRLGRFDEALESYERASAIRPSAPAFSNIGVLRHERGDYAGAVEAYEKALNLRSNSHTTHRNLGDALRKLGRLEEARRAYGRAIELAKADLGVNPRDAVTMGNLAVYLAKVGQFDAAKARLADALRLSPEDVGVLYRGAVVHVLARDSQYGLDLLAAALAKGYSVVSAARDDDFDSVRKSPRFDLLVGSRGGDRR